MARQSYTAQTAVRTSSGIVGTERDGHADGHSVANDGRIIMVVRNSGAGSHTISALTPGTVDGNAVADLSITVAAGVTRIVGPFPTSVYNQADGALYVDFDASPTEVKVQYVKVPLS